MDLERAVAACADTTRTHSATFHLGSRLFPARQRRAVRAVYAACRAGDDAVDEAPRPDEARRRLEAWWDAVERAYAGAPRGDEPFEVALAWVAASWDVPHEAFAELRRGLETDLARPRLRTSDELMTYCRRVAGTVGLMVAPIAGYDGGDDTLDAALALGQAMQLTNILRDVGEDLAMGRCYLPAETMARHGVTPDDLERGRVGAGYAALLEELAETAHALYRRGWRGIPRLHGAAAAAVGVAALSYEGILHKLRQNRYDNLTRRARLRGYERLALIPRAVADVVAGQ